MKYLYETAKGIVLGMIYMVYLGLVFRLFYTAFMFGWGFMEWTI
jgi:uncharacterized membrane protein